MLAEQKKEQVKDIYKNKIASILKDSTKLFSFTDGLVSSEADLFASAEKQVNAGYVASKTKSLSEVIKADDYNRVAKVACEALINLDATQIITNEGITLTENSNFLNVKGEVISLPKNAVLLYHCNYETSLENTDYLKSFQIGNQAFKIKGELSGSGWIDFAGYSDEAGILYTPSSKPTNPAVVYSLNQFRSLENKAEVTLLLEKGKLSPDKTTINQKQSVISKKFVNNCTSGGNVKDYVNKLVASGIKNKLKGVGYVFENCDGSEKQAITAENSSTSGKPVIIFRLCDGKLEVKDFKYGKTLTPNTKLAGVSQQELENEIKQRLKEEINNAQTNGKAPSDGKLQGKSLTEKTITNPDGSTETLKIDKSDLFAFLPEVVDLGESIYENAALPKKYWDPKEGKYNSSPIQMPGMVAGVSDGVIDEVTEKMQFIKLGLDVATKPEIITNTYNKIKN